MANASISTKPAPPRVIVTQVDEKTGENLGLLDTQRHHYPVGGASIHNLWQTNQTPADNNDHSDQSQEAREIVNKAGTAARLIDFSPGEIGPMHRTESVDYGVVLKGTITLELAGSTSTEIPEGCLIVQRGTEHRWINNTSDWVRVLFVIVPAKKVWTAQGTLDSDEKEAAARIMREEV